MNFDVKASGDRRSRWHATEVEYSFIIALAFPVEKPSGQTPYSQSSLRELQFSVPVMSLECHCNGVCTSVLLPLKWLFTFRAVLKVPSNAREHQVCLEGGAQLSDAIGP